MQFFWDFKNYTPGEVPPDWEVIDISTNAIVECVISENQTLKLTATPNGPSPMIQVYFYSLLPELEDVVDIDAVLRFKLSGSETIGTGILLESYEDLIAGQVSLFQNSPVVALNTTNVQDSAIGSIPIQPDTWYFARIKFDGPNLSIKYWTSGEPEPDWMLSIEDPERVSDPGIVSFLGSGRLGTSAATIEWDYIGIGINGVEAPIPKISTPQTIKVDSIHTELVSNPVIVQRGTDVSFTVPSSSISTSLSPVQLVKKRTVEADSTLLLLKPVTPNLDYTSPAILALETANGLVMGENFEYKISGSVVGYKDGIPVVVKYKINDAAPQEITSIVTSNEVSTYFSKLLVYRDKLLWDKDTPIIAVELEENVDHLLTVWIENERGIKIDEKIITFRVVQPTRFEYKISGNITGFRDGSTVTVKYKVNDSFEQVITTQIVNANESVRFEKTLEYRDGRLWDGTIDVVGYDLAFDVEHTITIWAEDDQGLRSEDITRTFTVVAIDPPDDDPFENLPPVLSVDTPDYWTLG